METTRAGLTTGEPSFPVGYDDLGRCKVATQDDDPRALLTLYPHLIALRTRGPELFAAGQLEALRASERVLSYWRRNDAGAVFVALNLGEAEETTPFEGEGSVLASTRLDRQDQHLQRNITLRPNEGVILGIRGSLVPDAYRRQEAATEAEHVLGRA
jgi:hypothetical protein